MTEQTTTAAITTAQTSTAQRLSLLLSTALGSTPPIRIRTWDGSETGPADAPVVEIRSRRALRRLLWQPDELGLAQCYVSGDIEVVGGPTELADGLRAAWQHARAARLSRVRPSAGQRLRLAASAVRLGAIGPRPAAPAGQAALAGTVHSQARDRAAISHHYDLSNAFYSLVLDESMAYSCGYYADPGMGLAQAQRSKLDLICRKLNLAPGQRLLDVGCGWGSLALHAAEHFGVQVLGVTISGQQQEFIDRRIAERGLRNRVQIRLQDYRELRGEPFDAVASVEMGEHVGEQNYPVYVGTLFSQLRPGGTLLLQQMSRRADAAPGGGAFIEHYIAPDMHMRPLGQTIGYLEAAGFEVLGVEGMRGHYVRTVTDWLTNFEAHFDEAVALVGPELARVWRLYLIGGRLSFEEARMGVDQILAAHPQSLAGHD